MRKLVVLEHISIDGVIQGPGAIDEDTSSGFSLGGWMRPYSDPVLGEFVRRQMNLPFDLLLGRRTFDIWETYWPHHADAWPGASTATKYVVSNTRSSSDWQHTVFLSGNVAGKITKIRNQEGPDLHVWGSANLVQGLMEQDLVDEFRLMVYPTTLGTGKRLFGKSAVPLTFRVIESTVTPSGVVIVNYEREIPVRH